MQAGTALATLNATLNGLSAVFLTAGLVFIKKKQAQRHRRCMLTAFGLSILFLISYVTRFCLTGVHRFAGQRGLRTFYLGLLGSHTALAAITPVLAIITLTFALRGRFDRHRKIARITWPIWMYVSVTGVAVYWMLYHL